MTNGKTGAALCLPLLAMPAGAKVALVPVPTGAETVRYLNGLPTLGVETASGSVRVTPLPFDHGHVSFGVAVYNRTQGATFGIENVVAYVGGAPVAVLSEAELARRAKSRATWSQIGIAVLAGAAAGVAAGAHTTDSYRGHLRTPNGVYSWAATRRDDAPGALASAAAIVGGAGAIATVQGRLDYTLANLGETIVQTTTVDRDASYGGRIVLEKAAAARLPYDVGLVVSWNGADYRFAFRVGEGLQASPAMSAPPLRPPAAPSPAPVPAVYAPPPGLEKPKVVVVAAPGPRPAARQPYRNGRDDAVIVPLE